MCFNFTGMIPLKAGEYQNSLLSNSRTLVQEAYRAYQQSVKDHGEELALPELGYTPTQLFWLSQASFHCEVNTPEYLSSRIQTDDHSPGRFRVIGPLSNSPEFASDWKCPAGSPMNPTKKCSVW